MKDNYTPFWFVKDYLPDYEKKRRYLAQDLKEEFSKSEIAEYDFEAGMVSEYFLEALQNFADRICEKQRENCANQDRWNFINEDKNIKLISMLDVEQPKIDEL